MRVHSVLAPTCRSLVSLYIDCAGGLQFSARPGRAPGIDASHAGQQALEMYDKNHDGVISGNEFDKAPSLKKSTFAARLEWG